MWVVRQVQRIDQVACYYPAGANAMKDALAGTNKIDRCLGLACGCVFGMTVPNFCVAGSWDGSNILPQNFCVLFRSLRLPMDILYERRVLAPARVLSKEVE